MSKIHYVALSALVVVGMAGENGQEQIHYALALRQAEVLEKNKTRNNKFYLYNFQKYKY